MQGIGDRPCALLPDRQALVRGKRLHFALDLIELADVLERGLRDLALVRRMQIEELATRVGIIWSTR
jgi:hypothetical protein